MKKKELGRPSLSFALSSSLSFHLFFFIISYNYHNDVDRVSSQPTTCRTDICGTVGRCIPANPYDKITSAAAKKDL